MVICILCNHSCKHAQIIIVILLENDNIYYCEEATGIASYVAKRIPKAKE